MPKELVFLGPRKVGFREYEERPLKDSEIRVRTIFSAISSGTELAIYTGAAPMFQRTVKDGLFEDGNPIYEYPMVYGYEEAAEVIEIGSGVKELKVGDLVRASYGHRETAILDVHEPYKGPMNFYGLIEIPPPMKMPKSMGKLEAFKAISAMSLGGLAYDAIITSGMQMGEAAVVFGQGQIGLCCTLLCKTAGAIPVIAVDAVDKRLELAKEFGASYVLNPTKCNVAKEVRSILRRETGGMMGGGAGAVKGADVVFDCTGSYKALQDAIRCAAPGYGKVIAVGFYKGPAKDLNLGEEFHHGLGALEIITAGPYARQLCRADVLGRKWGQTRLFMAYFRLMQGKEALLGKLISHVFKFEDALQAYEMLDKHPEDALKIILTFQN
jgi:2-desacetyl-2-hydroxyethyl bacteriochlorophyllide A dehydrogenase